MKWPEIRYVEAEDGMLDPVLEYPRQPDGSIGKYGAIRKAYLETHHKVAYTTMRLEGTLKQHLMDTNSQAYEMLDGLISRMQISEGVTEELKAADPLEWVARMNGIRDRAEEVVIKAIMLG